MRHSRIFCVGVQPEIHRYAQATFHDGAHRQAPGDSTPWRDASSPINRIKSWWLAPAAKGSMIAAWCITVVLGTYCFSIQQDAKGTYLLNNVLLRNLHEEALRADSNQERASELQEAMKVRVAREAILKRDHQETSRDFNDFAERVKKGLVNYELELSRERARADLIHDRNEKLVEELLKVRQELMILKKDNKRLSDELERVRKLSNQLSA